MKALITQLIQETANNPKAAATVSGSTVGTGILTIYELLPYILGMVATTAGLALSLVLIYTHLKTFKIKMQNLELEREALQRNLHHSKTMGEVVNIKK